MRKNEKNGLRETGSWYSPLYQPFGDMESITGTLDHETSIAEDIQILQECIDNHNAHRLREANRSKDVGMVGFTYS